MGDTRSELRLLKSVWDGKALVGGIHKSWNSQLWMDIKTDDLEDVNKNLLKNLRKVGNDSPVVKVRKWGMCFYWILICVCKYLVFDLYQL